MSELYWNIDPELVINQNNYFRQLNKKSHVAKNIEILCEEYKRVSKEIKKMIRKINGETFETVMPKIFDKEAYLAEIYFYLSEDILISTTDDDILNLIKKDYLLSYSWKLSEMNQKENVEFFLKNWTESKSIKQ